MKERNRVANVFTNIAPEWNNKGNLIASCIGQKNPFKTEYKNMYILRKNSNRKILQAMSVRFFYINCNYFEM